MWFFKIDGTANPSDALSKHFYRILHRHQSASTLGEPIDGICCQVLIPDPKDYILARSDRVLLADLSCFSCRSHIVCELAPFSLRIDSGQTTGSRHFSYSIHLMCVTAPLSPALPLDKVQARAALHTVLSSCVPSPLFSAPLATATHQARAVFISLAPHVRAGACLLQHFGFSQTWRYKISHLSFLSLFFLSLQITLLDFLKESQ
jgi:hypothetical protein